MPQLYPDALARGCSPAAERNKDSILDVLQRVLPEAGLVLEIGSGSGQHVLYFAGALPGLSWQPTDRDTAVRDSIVLAASEAGLGNIKPLVALDVLDSPWPISDADAVLCINMVHIAPWAATQALIRGASHVLPGNGVLFLYGPYRRFGRHSAKSNEAFDASLRGRNPDWGVRDLEDVTDLAEGAGFALQEVVEMPANNFSVIFRCKQPQS